MIRYRNSKCPIKNITIINYAHELNYNEGNDT